VQLLIGLDVLNGGKLNRDIAHGLGVQHQCLAVRFQYRTRKAVTVLQRYLVGEQSGRV